MSDVRQFRKPGSTIGGQPPDNDDMETRVSKLEDFAQDTRDRLTRIETKLDTFMTKEDGASLHGEIQKSTNDMIKWIVGTAVGLGVAGITVMTFVLNNASPKQQPQSQAPIVITIPSPAPTSGK